LEGVELVINIVLRDALEELNDVCILELRQYVSLIKPKLIVNFSCISACFRHVSFLERDLIGMTEFPKHFLEILFVNIDDGWLVPQFRIDSYFFET
jgi:hypothetical protein